MNSKNDEGRIIYKRMIKKSIRTSFCHRIYIFDDVQARSSVCFIQEFLCRYLRRGYIYFMTKVYDLVIVGAGCVGVAAAYYALQKEWNVCLVERQGIDSGKRYWSSSFSARQNRLQYNEEYLTRYVVESNKIWGDLEKNLGVKPETFLKKEGALWFGDKNVTTSQGNIKAANAVITLINSTAQNKNQRIESLYMEKLMEGTPQFMKAFKPYSPQLTTESQWDSWSALYQPDGGSVNMEASYKSLLAYIKQHKEHKVDIYDNTVIKAHKFDQTKNVHSFDVVGFIGSKTTPPPPKISGKRILLTVGIYTPFFLRDIMGQPYLVDNAKDEFELQQYVASYIKIKPDKPNEKTIEHLYQTLPNFANFIPQATNIQSKTKEPQYGAYGFRYHDWDNNDSKTSRFIKMGTLAYNTIDEKYLKNPSYGPIGQDDPRVVATNRYVKDRMNQLDYQSSQNKHYPCPIIFYEGRQTLLDYLNRTNESVVVQSGGWIGKYYPLLAKTAIMMLDDIMGTQTCRSTIGDVYGEFMNRTRFPITARVRTLLSKQVSEGKTHFNQAIIGGGCTGFYAAYRLNNQKHARPARAQEIGNIGLFQLSDRIAGRLKSFKFKGTTTPMEMGGMRYIPTNHVLVNQVITDLGMPSVAFGMQGDPIQNAARLCYLRNDYYRMDQWQSTQQSKTGLHTSYRIQGPIVGMNAAQIMSFSLYMILTAPENRNLLTQVFLEKSPQDVKEQRRRMGMITKNVPAEDSYFRDWKKFIYRDPQNKKNYNTNLSLKQWNRLKPILLFRFRYPIQDQQVYNGQAEVPGEDLYPLYKFGFQNVIQAQFGNEAYQFVAQQNGYLSNTSNASYLDQMMAYLLDFGNVSYRTLATGYDQLCFAMANMLFDSHKGLDMSKEGMFLNHKLVDILPGTAYGKKYVLVFHVPLQQPLKKINHLIPINRIKKLFKNEFQLGKRYPLPDNPGYAEIRFTADRVILGMPRKSVTILANEIELMRRPIKDYYLQVYNQLKKYYYNIFDYAALERQYQNGQKEDPLTEQQLKELQRLQAKQTLSFENPKAPRLTKQEAINLNNLSKIPFLKSLKNLTTDQKKYELSKVQKFELDSPIWPTDIFQLAQSAQLMPAMKVCMNFDRSWWNPNPRLNKTYQETYKNTNLVNSTQEMRGVSVTDMPLRQTLYFTQGPDNVLLASYNDMVNTQFWTALHDNFNEVWKPKNPKTRQIINKDTYLKSMDIHPAKKVLVKEILKQLSLLHQIDVKEEWVIECVYEFWGRDPYGAAYHNFMSGYYIPAVMKTMRKPWTDQNIYIVGEAFSNETGWVEGAYQTTELLLQSEYKLPQLVHNYYAGY